MNHLIMPILIAVMLSATMTVIFCTYYRMVFRRYDAPVHFFNKVKNRRDRRAHDRRVNEKVVEYKLLSEEDKSTVLSSMIILIIFVVIVFVLLFDVVYLVVVTSNSMRPTFEKDDLVLMQRINTAPEVGDIILFEADRYIVPVTHRIVTVSNSGVTTKGDAAISPDPWFIPTEDIQSKAIQMGDKPIVIKDVGNYFILESEQQSYGKYGQEYSFIKNMFLMVRMYGYALCVLAILGYLFLTIGENR